MIKYYMRKIKPISVIYIQITFVESYYNTRPINQRQLIATKNQNHILLLKLTMIIQKLFASNLEIKIICSDRVGWQTKEGNKLYRNVHIYRSHNGTEHAPHTQTHLCTCS